MTTNAKIRGLWVDEESAYATEVSADGSAYSALPLVGQPFAKNEQKTEESNYAHGRNGVSELIPTAQGGSLTFDWEPLGLSASAGDGETIPAEDGIDWLLNDALCDPIITLTGEGVGSGSTTSNLVLDASVAGLDDDHLLPVFYSVAPARVRWRACLSPTGAPTYTVTPDWDLAPPTSAVFYGSRQWGQTNQLSAQAPTLNMCLQQGASSIVQLSGGKHTALSITIPAGGVVRATSTIQFDSYADATAAKTALPAITTFASPPKGVYSPIYVNGTNHAVNQIKLDFGLQSSAVGGTEGANGRTDHQILSINPTIEIDPGYDLSVWHTLFEAGTVFEVLFHFGRGNSASRVNAYAFYAPRAQIESVSETDSQGYARHSVKIRVLDSAEDARIRWAFARA